MQDCLFCQIASGEKPSETVYTDETLVVFKDIHPKARVHLLIVPKKHIESVQAARDEDEGLLGRMILAARDRAKAEGLEGYKLLFNVGRAAGQVIDHVHLHLLGD